MSVLEHRLTTPGRQVKVFSYQSISDTLDDNARALRRFVDSIDTRALHFVGHSLGGLVVLRMLELGDGLPPGRIVLLGTPVRGSAAARMLTAWPWTHLLLGRSVEALAGGVPPWDGHREVGIIAGSLAMGLGRLTTGVPVPNDGTVAVEETRLDGVTAHMTLPVSHTSMLMSPAIARETIHFLENGRFSGTHPAD